MAPQNAFSPLHMPTEPKTISPADAEATLSKFLARAPKTPHMHPDAMLTTTGIQFSAHSGPTGGLAIHHLQRIAAALRGENLVMESREELEAVFGDEFAKGEGAACLGESDDTRLDASIGRRERSRDRVRAWNDGTEKNFLNEEYQTNGLIDFDAEGEDMETWQRSREMLEGELGERDGAPVEKQNGSEPVLRTHDGQGGIRREFEDEDGVVGGGAIDKAARKRAKKERRLAEKRGKTG